MRLKPTAKKTVGGTTSRSSLIRNAERPDLDINRFVRAFTADTRGVTQLTIAHPKSQEEFHRDDFTRSLQTDLGRWSNDDISNGYRLAARQWQEAEILLTLRVTIRVIFAPFRPALINLRSYIQWPDGRALGKLVYRLACNDDVVAFKMGRGKAVRAGLAVRGRISRSIRNRRATQPPAHFQRHPLGRGDPGQDCEER